MGLRLGNLDDKKLFTTMSYQKEKKDGSKYFTETTTNNERLKIFKEFCKKENIEKQDDVSIPIAKNKYHIFDMPRNILCGSENTGRKLHEHFKENKPLQKFTMSYQEQSK